MSGVPRDPMRRIVVVGGGPLGVMAAIALRKSLPVCQVVVIGQQPNPASFADWSTTAMPFTNKLHDRFGIDESRIVVQAGGSHRLVTRFLGWSGQGQAGALSYGETLDPALKTAFMRDWGGGGARNVNAARPVGSLAEKLVDAGRFAPPPPEQLTPISSVDYALRWNPAAYREILIEQAQALQVQYLEGVIEAVEHGESGLVDAIVLAGQGKIEADLIVDCSGPSATVLAEHPDFELVDWSESLPTRTIYLARPGASMVALEDRISLLDNGWLTETAGRDGLYTAVGVGAGVTREEALAALGAPAIAAIALQPARAAAPWLGNVVALGDAAARFEPLGPYHLDLAHRQLDLLLEMLPGRTIEPLERDEYNRRSVLMMEGVHEVLAMHFATRRAREVFGELELPDPLTNVLDQFSRRGRIPFREESPLLSQEQFAILAALGFAPGLPPAAFAGDMREEAAARQDFDAQADAALRFAPPYAQWLASVTTPNQAPV